MDVTGGVPETIELKVHQSPKAKSDLFEYLKDAYEKKALMAAAIAVSSLMRSFDCLLILTV